MMPLKTITYLAGIAAVVLLTACSSQVPIEIKQPLDGSPDLTQVRQQTAAYLSRKVRWGGVILKTENKQNSSELTIIAQPLNDEGKPYDADQSSGRFIAIMDKFMEPQLYSPDRKITITGQVLRTETRRVGEFPYEYPIIQVEHYYLWPPETEKTYYNYPIYPYYDPYYPWSYPYYRYPRHGHH
ncbi:MAG TPA: hypothetical protein ENJ87_10015 [Gammaproteobacteria bacterium]|nr:hypothetical protein [Gammaproteobacteria bacterium]